AGYKQAMSAAGAPEPRILRYGGPAGESEIDALGDTAPLPSAIVCSSDGTAFGIFRALARRGIEVPRDVSLTGYDNTRLSVSMNPQLTTVDIAFNTLGEEA